MAEGPKALSIGRHKISSVYIRDPDQNLIEISNYLSPSARPYAVGRLPNP